MVRTNGSTFTEILEGIDEKTTQIAQDTRIIRLQNDLEILDREWEMKRKQMMILNSNNKPVAPNKLDVQMGAFFSFFSLLVSGILAYNLGSLMLLAIGFILAFVLFTFSLDHNSKLTKYQHAITAYQKARNDLTQELNQARKTL